MLFQGEKLREREDDWLLVNILKVDELSASSNDVHSHYEWRCHTRSPTRVKMEAHITGRRSIINRRVADKVC
jgi:hypothetical protein